MSETQTQAEAAAQDFSQFVQALLLGTLEEWWPGIKVEYEVVAPHVCVTAVSFADGSSWAPTQIRYAE